MQHLCQHRTCTALYKHPDQIVYNVLQERCAATGVTHWRARPVQVAYIVLLCREEVMLGLARVVCPMLSYTAGQCGCLAASLMAGAMLPACTGVTCYASAGLPQHMVCNLQSRALLCAHQLIVMMGESSLLCQMSCEAVA
jgi:hypothetical protein